MALLSEVGTLASPTSTGTQAITLTSFGGATPVAVILWSTTRAGNGLSADALFAIGAATSSTNRASVATNQESGGSVFDEDRRHDDTVVITVMNAAGTVIEKADLASFTADTFTLDWETVDGTARDYHWCALGGTGVEANVVSLQAPLSTGNQNYAHGLAGAPTALLGFSANNLAAAPSQDFAAEAGMSLGASDITTDVFSGVFISNSGGGSSRVQSGNFLSHANPATVHEAAVVSSVDGTNITLNWTQVNSAEYYYILALRGVVAESGTYTSPTSAGTKIVTTSFAPKLFMTFGVQDVASASVEDDARLVFGIGTGSDSACGGLLNRNGNGEHFSFSNAILKTYDHSQCNEESASLLAFSGNDVQLNFTLAVTALNEFNYLALGDAAGAGTSTNVEVVAWRSKDEPGGMQPVIYFAE